MINTLKDTYAVDQLLDALEVSKSGFHAHQHKAQGSRRKKDQELIEVIKPLFEQSRRTYGSPRLCAALRAQGQRCGKNRVARLMRQSGLRPRQKRRFPPQTTQSKHNLPLTQNWLVKVPTPDRPNQFGWLISLTFPPLKGGFIWPWNWTRAHAKSLAGLRATISAPPWSWKPGTELLIVILSLQASSTIPIGVSQYASSDFQSLLRKSQACGSMSRPANPYDNAMMESFFATLKTQCFGQFLPPTRAAARLMLFDYIEGFYNIHRRHSSLANRSPLGVRTINFLNM